MTQQYTSAGNPLCTQCHQVIVAEDGQTCASIPAWQRGQFTYCDSTLKGTATMTHFIAMSGSHGCLPEYCQAHESDLDAAVALGAVHDLTGRDIKRLAREHYLELGGPETGAEYAEIIGCNCATPSDHDDSY